MVKKLKEIWSNDEDNKFNILMGLLPIEAKIVAEDLGIISKGSFSSMTGLEGNPKDKELAEKTFNSLEQEGFGKGRVPLNPFKKKGNSWIEHVKSYQKEHCCTYKEALIKSKLSYNK